MCCDPLSNVTIPSNDICDGAVRGISLLGGQFDPRLQAYNISDHRSSFTPVSCFQYRSHASMLLCALRRIPRILSLILLVPGEYYSEPQGTCKYFGNPFYFVSWPALTWLEGFPSSWELSGTFSAVLVLENRIIAFS